MRFFENDSLDPYFNQAYEEYIFRTYREGVNFLVWRNRASVICGAVNACRRKPIWPWPPGTIFLSCAGPPAAVPFTTTRAM